jgi:Trk-type K+ transport systems, membrane components
MTKTFNWKIVIRTYGALLLIEALFMAIPTVAAYLYGDHDGAAFAVSTLITLLFGAVGMRWGRNAQRRVSEREGYLIVALVWIVFSLFGMLPFYLSGALDTITDSWFETMAGFSTMGATVIENVEVMSHAILLWRAIMQWLGGMGIIVLSVAVLPLFGLGGMQLYAAEVTGVSYEKLSPRITNTARLLWGTYVFLTLIETLLLNFFGMDMFDSVCHSMATVATGGFSTKNTSLMLCSPAIQYTVAVFMLLSGINFSQIIFFLRGKPDKLYHDEETRWYVGAVLICTVVLTLGLFVYYAFIQPAEWLPALLERNMLRGYAAHAEWAFRNSFFTTCAAITSTGFASADYMLWPKLIWVFVFLMMFTGGASGSTAGGIKWVRIAIFAKNAFAEMYRRIHPNAVLPIRFNGRPLSQTVTNNVMAFLFFYVVIIILATMIFIACGISPGEAFATAVSGMGNVGESLGQYGPAGNYANFPIVAKWVMTVVMLIGRLEIFTVLLLFSPVLWRK